MQLRELKDDVKAVVDALAAAGITVQHTVMLDAISKGFGERGWSAHREALAALAKAGGHASVAASKATAPAPWTPESGPMTDAQFLAVKGQRCPCCGSDAIDYSSSFQSDGSDGWTGLECGDCQATWQEAWGLTGYFDLQAPPSSKEGTSWPDQSSPEDGSGFLADGEFVSVWDGGREIVSPARLNLHTGLVDEIELVDIEDVTTLDEQFFRVANAPDYKFSLVTNTEGAFVGSARLKQIRRLLRVENQHAKADFAIAGMSLAETYSCVSGSVVEQFADGTARESVEHCLLLNGAVVSYDPSRHRQVNEAGAVVVSRYFVPSLDVAQAEPAKFSLEQLADAGKFPLAPYNESFHIGDEDLERLRTLVRQGKLIVGAVELAALLERIRQLNTDKRNHEKARQSGEEWQINAAKDFYGKREAWELERLTELHEATIKGYKVD